MAQDKTYFTINLPRRYRALLEDLAARSRRSKPNVIATLLEQGARHPELIGVPRVDLPQRAESQPAVETEAAR
jgi:hypothetical protein